jgi:hypothetical protein
MATTVWNKVGSTDIYVVMYTGIELAEVKENGTALDKLSSTALTSGSFYHNVADNKLYLRASDDTSPNVNGYNYIGFSWFGFCDRQPDDNRIDFAIQGGNSVYYHPFLDTESMSSIKQSVNEFYLQNIVNSFGGLKFTRASFFYDLKGKYEFNNIDVYVKYGNVDDDYGDFITFFHGLAKDPKWNDTGFSFNLSDLRLREFGSIPPGRYSIDDYPKLATGATDLPIPVLLGNKTNITPVEIDTEIFKYKITQTTFNGVTFNMEELTTVKKDGVIQTVTTDYTVDLTNGEFTMLVDPGDSIITCDAKGLQIEFNFSTELYTGNYSENIAEITYFVLNILDEIDKSLIDLDSFDNLKTRAAQLICGDYIQQEIKTSEYVPILQATGTFHLISDSDGKIKLSQYRTTGTVQKSFVDSDYLKGFSFGDDTKSFFVRIIVNYDLDPTAGNYKESISDNTSQDNPKYKYQENRSKDPINTIITDSESASDLAVFYKDFFETIPVKIQLKSTNFDCFPLLPTDKISITRSYLDESGAQQFNFNDVNFIILSIGKDIVLGTVNINCQKDVVTSAGQAMLYLDGTAMEYEGGDVMEYEGG